MKNTTKRTIIVIVSLLIAVLFIISAFIIIKNNKKETVNVKKSSSQIFKEDYEKVSYSKKNEKLRDLSISEKNPFYEVTVDEIVEMMENKKSFYIYFGDERCPWCRSTLEKCIESARKNGVYRIYYVKLWGDNFKESFRDKYDLENGVPVKTEEGTEGYKKLLSYFNALLKDYTLTNDNGEKINVGEKRIYGPNYICVNSGVATKLVTGVSSLQKNSNDELTPEILNEEEKIFDDFFKSQSCGQDGC